MYYPSLFRFSLVQKSNFWFSAFRWTSMVRRKLIWICFNLRAITGLRSWQRLLGTAVVPFQRAYRSANLVQHCQKEMTLRLFICQSYYRSAFMADAFRVCSCSVVRGHTGLRTVEVSMSPSAEWVQSPSRSAIRWRVGCRKFSGCRALPGLRTLTELKIGVWQTEKWPWTVAEENKGS